mgnify:CR=1 FL=1
MNQYVKQYQKSNIETASREQILIMLYDGAIQFLNKAKIAIEKHDTEAAHNNLISTQNIIYEFINSLDREIAPDLAARLTSLYEYFIRRLVHANMKKEIAPIDEVLGYLKSLKATWEKAIEISKKEAAAKMRNNDSIDGYDDEDAYIDDYEEDDEEV